MKQHPRTLARRYARALHQVAVAEGGDRPRQLRSELDTLLALLEKNPELAATVSHPALRAEARARALCTILEKAGGSALLARLVALVVGRERVGMLRPLAEAYGEELLAAEGTVAATAVSAVPLDEPQRLALATALSQAAGKRVDLTNQVDPAVIGGALVRMGDRTYDGTVRAHLSALRRRLAAGR
jgi:F-type H+-transporting ATPase subunit delta